VVCVCVLHNH